MAEKREGKSVEEAELGPEIPLAEVDGEFISYDDLAATAANKPQFAKFWESHLGLSRGSKDVLDDKTRILYAGKDKLEGYRVVYYPKDGYEHFFPDFMGDAVTVGQEVPKALTELIGARKDPDPSKWRKVLEKNADTLFSEYKIHLQPKREYLPLIVDRLVKLIDERPDLKPLIAAFKAKIGDSVMRQDDGRMEQAAELVIYPKVGSEKDASGKSEGRKNMETVLRAILEATEDLETTSNGKTPRENAKITDLVYVAQAGGDLKNVLREAGVIDEYMEKDASGNYSFRKGEVPPAKEYFAELARKEAERRKESIKRMGQEAAVRDASEAKRLIAELLDEDDDLKKAA